jgi:phage gpG-like protein
MRIAITLEGAAEAQQLLAATAARLSQPPGPLLTDLASALQSNLQLHIQTQTGPEGPWPPLSPVTRKIRAYYGYPPDGPALIRSGDLLQSITTLTQEDRAVEVGTRSPFARTLQDGGTLTDPRSGHPRTIQPFPFLYVTAQETEDLLATITTYYFGAPNA